jgi:hypothetical protein
MGTIDTNVSGKFSMDLEEILESIQTKYDRTKDKIDVEDLTDTTFGENKRAQLAVLKEMATVAQQVHEFINRDDTTYQEIKEILLERIQKEAYRIRPQNNGFSEHTVLARAVAGVLDNIEMKLDRKIEQEEENTTKDHELVGQDVTYESNDVEQTSTVKKVTEMSKIVGREPVPFNVLHLEDGTTVSEDDIVKEKEATKG